MGKLSQLNIISTAKISGYKRRKAAIGGAPFFVAECSAELWATASMRLLSQHWDSSSQSDSCQKAGCTEQMSRLCKCKQNIDFRSAAAGRKTDTAALRGLGNMPAPPHQDIIVRAGARHVRACGFQRAKGLRQTNRVAGRIGRVQTVRGPRRLWRVWICPLVWLRASRLCGLF
jgi:hypothetical protein